MKKKIISTLCACAMLLGIGGTATIIAPETTHSIAHAAQTIWQCTKCGTQRKQQAEPQVSTCAKGGKHVWARLQ